MMQETVLRVFVVALGLLLCPRDPGVEEWDEQQHPFDQRPTEKYHLSESDVIVPEEPGEGADRILPASVAKSATDLQEDYISKAKPEENGTNILKNSSSKEPGNLQGGNKKPEEMEEQKSPFPRVQTKAAETVGWERDYVWFIWNTFSIISMMNFIRKYVRRNFRVDQGITRTFPAEPRVAEVLLPDVATMHHFYAKCVQISSEKWRDGEFLEGFANDLLDAMRSVCDDVGSVVIEDFQVVNPGDVVVHLTPPEPYRFQCRLGNDRASDPLSDMRVCGQIKLVEEKKIQNGCPCQSSDVDEDMVCLLHCEGEKVKTKTVDVSDGLCSKNSPFLSKAKVSRWFQNTIKQAWAQISHKYEFELNIRYMEAPGSLVIRFRSGKKILFNMNPVIKFNADAHFSINPWSSSNSDIFWPLSLTNYEDRFLEHLSKLLPENSCHNQTLEIACFLHRRQRALSGGTGLKESHFKMALMHLLLTKKSSQWNPDCVARRLQDLLEFIEKSLEKKLLTHVLIGNPLAEVIKLPREVTRAKPVNLFHPFVVHSCIYRNAVHHFQEMLRNTHMLIHEYVAQHTNDTGFPV